MPSSSPHALDRATHDVWEFSTHFCPVPPGQQWTVRCSMAQGRPWLWTATCCEVDPWAAFNPWVMQERRQELLSCRTRNPDARCAGPSLKKQSTASTDWLSITSGSGLERKSLSDWILVLAHLTSRPRGATLWEDLEDGLQQSRLSIHLAWPLIKGFAGRHLNPLTPIVVAFETTPSNSNMLLYFFCTLFQLFCCMKCNAWQI